jgi:hypothetical protein
MAKGEEVLRKQKEAKQKKILLILLPILLVAAGIQLPKLLGGDDEAAPTSSESVATDASGLELGSPSPVAPIPAPGAPAPAPPASGTPVAGVPAVPGDAALLGTEVVEDLDQVDDSDQPLEAGEGQLVSFSRFTARDPFVQLVVPPTDTQPEEPASPDEADDPSSEGSTPDGTTAPGVPAGAGAAVIDTNGVKETVPLNGVFPASDPAFRLLEITPDNVARIGLVEGSYSSGTEAITLELGETVVLVSQPDGYRYTIAFEALASGDSTVPAPAAPPAS